MAEERKKERSSNVKEWLNPLVSMFDREIRRGAEWLASKVPKDSPLRSSLAERALGTLASIIERLGKGKGPVVELASEKSSDFADRFSSALFGKGGPEGKKEEGRPRDGGGPSRDWMDGFLGEAAARLRKSQEPLQEFDHLLEEFRLRLSLNLMVESAREAKTKKPTEPAPKIRRRKSPAVRQLENFLQPTEDFYRRQLAKWKGVH